MEVSLGHSLQSLISFARNTKKSSWCRIFKALKQIFGLESIPCVYLGDIWNRLLAKVCFDASFMC